MKPLKFLKDPHKRNWFFAGAAAVAGLSVLAYAGLIETRRYRLDAIRVDTGEPDGGAPAAKDLLRLRILHLSDLHFSFPESRHKLEFLKWATSQACDLIFITGDIFEDASGIPYLAKMIARPPRLGTFAVLGNHDCFDYNIFYRIIGKLLRTWRIPKKMRDLTPFVEALEAAGIHVLRNAAARPGGENLYIIGIDYPTIGDRELLALAGQARPGDLVLALMHAPNQLMRLPGAGVHLAFGGHTHGGQISVPFLGPLYTDSELPPREASGLIWRGSTAIHVSRGIGADPRTNFRLFCPPHATIIEVCHRRSS
jgi:uncharacterized protein